MTLRSRPSKSRRRRQRSWRRLALPSAVRSKLGPESGRRGGSLQGIRVIVAAAILADFRRGGSEGATPPSRRCRRQEGRSWHIRVRSVLLEARMSNRSRNAERITRPTHKVRHHELVVSVRWRDTAGGCERFEADEAGQSKKSRLFKSPQNVECGTSELKR